MSEALARAAMLAIRLHDGQTRKGSKIPYVSHCFAVSALVMEAGGTEAQAIAALLHDGPEDAGGRAVLEEIRPEFGEEVAAIVEACSDTFENPKPPWRARKQAFIDSLATTPEAALLVIAADKLHNAECLVRDLAAAKDPEAVFAKFNGGREGTIWYYAAVAEALGERLSGVLVKRLHLALTHLEPFATTLR